MGAMDGRVLGAVPRRELQPVLQLSGLYGGHCLRLVYRGQLLPPPRSIAAHWPANLWTGSGAPPGVGLGRLPDVHRPCRLPQLCVRECFVFVHSVNEKKKRKDFWRIQMSSDITSDTKLLYFPSRILWYYFVSYERWVFFSGRILRCYFWRY